MGVGRGLTTLPPKKKIVEKPPRNSVGFCGGGQVLSWAVEPRKEDISYPSTQYRTLLTNPTVHEIIKR
jgi:hypothetical protein